MNCASNKFLGNAVIRTGVALAIMIASSAQADVGQAKALLKAMSDHLAEQKTVSFDYDSNLEIVTKDDQKIGFASSGSLLLVRPNRIHATRHGGFADVELVFDGTMASLLNKESNAFTQMKIPGSVDNLIDVLRTDYGRPLPAADLLMSKAYDNLMEEVVDVKDLGSGFVHGLECDHLAFRTDEVDWQIWISQGSHPHPLRYSITSKKIKASPQYTIDLSNFKDSKVAAAASFEFRAPKNAKRVKASELIDFDDLPDGIR